MSTEWSINKEVAREYLADPDTKATTLHAIALATLGFDEIYGSEDEEPMDPVELFVLLEENYRTSIPVENENKLNAIMLATSTEAFFYHPEPFSAICLGIASGDLGDLVHGTMEDPTVAEMLTAIMEVQLNHDSDTEFSNKVNTYIDSILATEAIDNLEDEEVEDFTENLKLELFQELKNIGVPDDYLRHAESILA